MSNTEAISDRSIGPLTPEKVEAVESDLLKLTQADCPLNHLFGAGICIRCVTMPAGALVIGHGHRFADWNIMLTGRLTLLNDDGSLSEISAPKVFLGNPGRKIAWVHEKVTWLNLFATDETDAEKVEHIFLNKSKTWESDQRERRAIEYLSHQPDRDDFGKVIRDLGFSAEQVRKISEDESDQIPFPEGMVSRVMVLPSPIEGRGLFATQGIKAGEVIAVARIGGNRTPAGRFTNHSAAPNAKMLSRGGVVDLVAITDIKGCQGGQAGDEITVSYRQAIQERIQLCQQ